MRTNSFILTAALFCFANLSFAANIYKQNCAHRYGYSPFSEITFTYKYEGEGPSQGYFNITANYKLTEEFKKYGPTIFSLEKRRIRKIDIKNDELKFYSQILNQKDNDPDWGSVELSFQQDDSEDGPLLLVNLETDGPRGFSSFRCEPFKF